MGNENQVVRKRHKEQLDWNSVPVVELVTLFEDNTESGVTLKYCVREKSSSAIRLLSGGDRAKSPLFISR